MKIYVVCDLEGVAGVVDHAQQCQWDAPKGWYAPFLEQARRLATLELNALVEGALEGGATEVVAWDGHGNFPGGLDYELLHPECRLVMAAGDGGPVGLDASFAALFLLGLHAMAGAPGGLLAHTFHGGLKRYTVNGLAVGEIWMNCFIAGREGVPFVFLSGDRAAVNEARALVPQLETAVVKEGLFTGEGGLKNMPAVCLAPEKARQVIRQAARQAMKKTGSIAPYRMEPPYHLIANYTEASFAEHRRDIPDVVRIDDMTLEIPEAEEPWLLI